MTETLVREPLAHPPLGVDVPEIRPTLESAVAKKTRGGLIAGAAVVGAAAGLVAAASTPTAMTAAVIATGAVTALAANWSTCGMSVAGVVAAPKQPGRRGSSTPIRRLGWHTLGSLATGIPTGALFGALGALVTGSVPWAWTLAAWGVIALGYG
ncbi:methylamine utilization protein, partial [Rhodococcus opacus]|nr:methylamine utilization protein [Rhodococcus opacus]